MREIWILMRLSLISGPFSILRSRQGESARSESRRDRLAVGRLPAPGARPIAALAHPLLVDLGDDLAVTGEQRLGRAHFGAERQLALDQPVGAVFGVVLR